MEIDSYCAVGSVMPMDYARKQIEDNILRTRNEEFIRKESQTMVQNYLEGILKVQRCTIQIEQLQEHARNIIDGCFKSFLDKDFNTRLTQILPQIEKR